MKRSLQSQPLNKSTLLLGVLLLTTVVPLTAQAGGGSDGELQQKLAAVKQSVADNQAAKQLQVTTTSSNYQMSGGQ